VKTELCPRLRGIMQTESKAEGDNTQDEMKETSTGKERA
jgi:hypothetical protein